MPSKTTKTSGNKWSDDNRKTSLWSSWKGWGTLTNPLEIGNSEADETESALRLDEADLAHQTKNTPSQSFNPRDTSSASSHQSQLLATDEETRAAAATLEMLWKTDDPDKSPSGEDEYFQGPGLWDNISHSQAKRKSHSHQTIQKLTTDTPTSTIMSVLIKAVPPAKVLIDDMVNFSLRLGLPNPLKVAAGGDKLPADSKQKKLPHPPDETRVLMELPSDTSRRKPELLTADSSKPTESQQQAMLVTVHVSEESDFAAGIHQIIPSEPCYSPPLWPNADGGLEMGYDGAVQVVDFEGMYYFKLGYLQPGYTNAMPYDHPLDWQGHIALTSHSGVVIYTSNIGLVASGIPITVEIKEREVLRFYFDVVRTVPDSQSPHLEQSTLPASCIKCIPFPVWFWDLSVWSGRRIQVW